MIWGYHYFWKHPSFENWWRGSMIRKNGSKFSPCRGPVIFQHRKIVSRRPSAGLRSFCLQVPDLGKFMAGPALGFDWRDTVDGSEIRRANQLRLVVYPTIYVVLYIPGGCLGFLPLTVCPRQTWTTRKRYYFQKEMKHRTHWLKIMMHPDTCIYITWYNII